MTVYRGVENLVFSSRCILSPRRHSQWNRVDFPRRSIGYGATIARSQSYRALSRDVQCFELSTGSYILLVCHDTEFFYLLSTHYVILSESMKRNSQKWRFRAAITISVNDTVQYRAIDSSTTLATSR